MFSIGHIASVRSNAGSRSPNPTLNVAYFVRLTLRDKAAPRQLALR
ncbi:MAG: hypothetical protein ABIQ44_12680 [Chloroflexia bacterium]